MKYYKMIYAGNEAFDEKHIGSDRFLNQTIHDYAVCKGRYVDNWDPEITLVCDNVSESVVPDWISSDNMWMIVSQKFVDTVAHLEDGAIQYLPIKIDAVQPQMKDKKYFVANVIKMIDAIDYENSFYFNLNLGRAMVKYALKKEQIEGNHIFKVIEDNYGRSTFVSEEFKKAMKKAKLLGFDFVEVKVV